MVIMATATVMDMVMATAMVMAVNMAMAMVMRKSIRRKRSGINVSSKRNIIAIIIPASM